VPSPGRRRLRARPGQLRTLSPHHEHEDKGLAEHAVHFDAAKDWSTGKPFHCSECHIGFGTSQQTQKLLTQQGHDLRLCYDCHGSLDYRNRLKAKYPGNQLCLRCHTDLHI
jgi:uncharacterized paraquat-inducible protein A